MLWVYLLDIMDFDAKLETLVDTSGVTITSEDGWLSKLFLGGKNMLLESESSDLNNENMEYEKQGLKNTYA